MSYYYSGQYDKALQLYKELYKENPGYTYYRYYLNSLIQLKKFNEAEKLVKKQLKMSPDSFRFKIDLAYLYSLEGNNKKKDKILNKVISSLPDNRNIIINIAYSLQSHGFFDKAVYVYNVAREKGLGDYDYDFELATAYNYSGDYEKMFDLLLDYANKHPEAVDRVKSRVQSLLLRDVDDNLSGLFRKKILLRAQADPSNPVYAEMLMWYSLQVKDFDLALRQAISIDKRFRDQEEKLLDVAEVAYSNGNYDIAVKASEYLLKKKKKNPFLPESYEMYFKARLKLVTEKGNKVDKKTWEELEKAGETSLENSGYANSTALIKDLAHLKAFRLNKPVEAINLLDKGIEHSIYSKDKAVLKMEKADILAFTGKFWEASLLYAQVENSMKNEPLGYEAKFRNARLFYFKGEFQWAKTRLDVLKGSTSKLIANDAIELSFFIKEMLEIDTLGLTLREFAAADQYAYQQKYDSALIFLKDIEQSSSLPFYRGNVLFKEGQIFEKIKEFGKADSVYTLLFQNYPESVKADNALFRSAEINRLYLKNIKKAGELYLKIMKNYPESIYATEARKKYRNLKKENGTS